MARRGEDIEWEGEHNEIIFLVNENHQTVARMEANISSFLQNEKLSEQPYVRLCKQDTSSDPRS